MMWRGLSRAFVQHRDSSDVNVHILLFGVSGFVIFIFFFFFQAEDGIRDGHVTGVQTCALPILRDIRGQWSGLDNGLNNWCNGVQYWRAYRHRLHSKWGTDWDRNNLRQRIGWTYRAWKRQFQQCLRLPEGRY